MTTTPALGGRVRRGLAWSATNTGTLRLASLVLGIVLARILAPEDFGVFAIALMVQAILVNFAELGLAADLVRHGDLRGRGPTITTIALVASGLLTALTWLAAGPVAGAMGAPEAGPVIQVMGLTLLLAGVTAVPYAQLQREFQQGRLFCVELSNFGVGTAITLVLCLQGNGAMSLAIGRVAGQLVATVLMFAVTRQRLRVGWRRDVAVSGLRFGVPLATAGLLAWTLLNVDTVVVGSIAGATLLGFYVLAFNISSWPSTVIGTAVRAVAFPAFAQRAAEQGRRDTETLVQATSLVWAVALPVGTGLAVAAAPVVELVYGSRWLPAAAALAGLGVFGAFRVTFDLWVAYLTSCGAGSALMGTQVAWIVLLTPAMVVGTRAGGIAGAAWAHVVVAAGLMLPVYLWTLRRWGARPLELLGALVPGLLAIGPAGLATWGVVRVLDHPLAQLLGGASVMIVVYTTPMLPWARRVLERLPGAHVDEPLPAPTPTPGPGVPAPAAR